MQRYPAHQTGSFEAWMLFEFSCVRIIHGRFWRGRHRDQLPPPMRPLTRVNAADEYKRSKGICVLRALIAICALPYQEGHKMMDTGRQYVIQERPMLRSTWRGAHVLWSNFFQHLFKRHIETGRFASKQAKKRAQDGFKILT